MMQRPVRWKALLIDFSSCRAHTQALMQTHRLLIYIHFAVSLPLKNSVRLNFKAYVKQYVLNGTSELENNPVFSLLLSHLFSYSKWPNPEQMPKRMY